MLLTGAGDDGGDGSVLSLLFTNGAPLPASVTFSRPSSATDLLYTASSGTYNTYLSGVARLLALGFLIEEARTQSLGVTDTPGTQTITLSAGTYTHWMIGSGSLTSAAGTAVGSGFGAATQGVPKTITITTGGTVVFTVGGTVTRIQNENGAFPTSYIPNAGAVGTTVTRSADLATVATSSFAWNGSAGSFALQMIMGGTTQNNPRFIGENAATPAFMFMQNTASPFALSMFDGANLLATANTAALNSVFKGASSFAASGQSIVLNGGTVATSVNSFAPGATTLVLGSGGVGNVNTVGQAWFQRVRYFNQRLPDATLQSLTA